MPNTNLARRIIDTIVAHNDNQAKGRADYDGFEQGRRLGQDLGSLAGPNGWNRSDVQPIVEKITKWYPDANEAIHKVRAIFEQQGDILSDRKFLTNSGKFAKILDDITVMFNVAAGYGASREYLRQNIDRKFWFPAFNKWDNHYQGKFASLPYSIWQAEGYLREMGLDQHPELKRHWDKVTRIASDTAQGLTPLEWGMVVGYAEKNPFVEKSDLQQLKSPTFWFSRAQGQSSGLDAGAMRR